MKIYDGKYILVGLIVFIVLATFPVWFTHGRTVPPPDLKLDTPVISKMVNKQCILPKEEMITGHMKLLNEWRTQVVRYGKRMYVAADGKTYEMSLQNECMKCHSNKAQFCDRCHNYAGLEKDVDPYCWNCHIAPKETESKEQGATAKGREPGPKDGSMERGEANLPASSFSILAAFGKENK